METLTLSIITVFDVKLQFLHSLTLLLKCDFIKNLFLTRCSVMFIVVRHVETHYYSKMIGGAMPFDSASSCLTQSAIVKMYRALQQRIFNLK